MKRAGREPSGSCGEVFLRSKRGVAALAALLLVLFLFRPGVYRLRNRIAITIGSALGRKVALDNVRLHLLPRPGFDLEGLVIYDDPAFSAEPMIRAQEVSAAIRFRSLLRGRLEIATLSATEPSINLVRNDQGRWNLASLLERNAQIPAAPTGKRASERRPAFPYLEAGHARINFKIGQTKKSYALMDADVALWQDSENSWGARIKAEPVRTDFNLTDTGLAPDQRHLAARSEFAVDPVATHRAMAEWATGTDHEVAERKRPGMARRSKFHGEVIGHSGSAADRKRDRNRRFPPLRHCGQRERAPGNRLLGTVQRDHQLTCRPAVRIASRRRDAPPARERCPWCTKCPITI